MYIGNPIINSHLLGVNKRCHLTPAWLRTACEDAGASRVADYNAGQLAGVAPVQLCTDGSGGGRQDCFSSLGWEVGCFVVLFF